MLKLADLTAGSSCVFGQRESSVASTAGSGSAETAGGIAGRAAEPHQGSAAARPGRGQPGGVDLLVAVGDFNFVVECKTKGEAAAVAMAARSVKEFRGG